MKNLNQLKSKVKELEKDFEELLQNMTIPQIESFFGVSFDAESKSANQFRAECADALEQMNTDELIRGIDWLIEDNYSEEENTEHLPASNTKFIQLPNLKEGQYYWVIEDNAPCYTCFDENSTRDNHEFETKEDALNWLVANVYPQGIKFARKCDCCGEGMNKGYVIDGGRHYFCSEACLDTSDLIDTTAEEISKMTQEEMDESETYWTEWESEDDAQYIFINGELKEL